MKKTAILILILTMQTVMLLFTNSNIIASPADQKPKIKSHFIVKSEHNAQKFFSASQAKFMETNNKHTRHIVRVMTITVTPSNQSTVLDSDYTNLELSVVFSDSANVQSVEIRYSYDRIAWSGWLLAQNDSNRFYIVVSESEWKQHIGGVLYWEVNRTNTNGTFLVYGTYLVYLGDDDPDPPAIKSISVIEYGSSDGVLETDDYLKVRVFVWDKSGISDVSAWCLYGSYNVSLVMSFLFQNESGYMFESNVFGPVGSEVLNVYVKVSDLDSDGWAGDSLVATDSETFYLVREQIYLIVNPQEIVMNYSDVSKLEVFIKRDDGGVALDGLNISLVIYDEDGNIYHRTYNISENAKTVFYINNSELGLEPGQYYINVTFLGNAYFDYAKNTSWLHIWTSTRIIVEMNSSAKYGQLFRIKAQLLYGGGPFPNARLEFYYVLNDSVLIGVNYTGVDGWTFLDWRVNVTPGIQISILVRFVGLPHYYGSENSSIVEIYKSVVVIELYPKYNFVYTDGGIITGNISDEFGNPISGVNILIYVYYKSGWVFVGSNKSFDGKILVRFSKLSGLELPLYILPGTYDLRVVFGGNDYYLYEASESTIIIARENLVEAELDINSSVVEWSDGLSITIIAKDDEGEPVYNVNATLILDYGNGVERYYLTLDGSPAVLNYKVLIDAGLNVSVFVSLNSTAYNISVGYLESNFSVVNEELYPYVIGLNDSYWRVLYGVQDNITLLLLDNDNSRPLLDGLAELIVESGLENTSYNFTVFDGQINLVYPNNINFEPGIYTIYLTRVYISNYVLAEPLVLTLEIAKLTTQAQLVYWNATYTDTGRLEVRLLDENGDNVSNVRVIMYVGDIMAEAVTNSSGLAVFTFYVSIEPGEYVLYINWGATRYYEGGSLTLNVTVEKENLVLDIYLENDPIVWVDNYIVVNITDDEGNEIDSPVWLILKVGSLVIYNDTYTGVFKTRWVPDKAGKVTITAQVLENKLFRGASKTLVVEVHEQVKSESQLYVYVPVIIVLVTLFSMGGLVFFFRRRKA